jgi:uncharacterized protein
MLTMNKASYISETKDGIEIAAPAKTDFFIDERNGIEKSDAPFYYEKRKGDFVMKARVRPEFKKNYDAGGLFVYDSSTKWIKLEFERTDLGYPSVVSVITDKTSDDANGEKMEGAEEVSLQVVRKGDYWVLHYSADGRSWKMVRYFKLKMKEEVKIGLEAQSPLGGGCKVAFSGLKITDNDLKDIRKGK